jgi:ATP-binding cassette, subfamily C, bacterial CydC
VKVTEDPLLRMLRLGRMVRGRLLLAAAAGAAATGCAVALLAVSGFLLARASQHPGIVAITAAVVAVRAFSVGRGVFRYAERLTAHDAAFRVLADTRVAIYRRLARLAPAGLAAFRSGDLLARLIADVDTTQDLFIRGAVQPLAAALAGAGAVTACLLILAPAGGILALGLLAGGLAVPAVAAVADRTSRRRTAPARGELAASLANTLAGAADLHAFGAQDAALARMAATDAELTSLARRSAAATGLGTGLTSLASGLTVWGVLILGVAAVGSGTFGRVPLAVVTLTALAAFEAVTPLTGAALQVGQAHSAARRVCAVLDAPDPVREPPRPLPPPDPPVTVTLRGARVRYRPDAAFALDGLDLDLAPGRRVALVGPNGAGKSTVAALLMRFADLAGGTATLCGHDLASYAADDVRRLIGGCPQDPHVFDATIADNLRLARPGASDDELAGAAARARLLPWIESLPKGFQTPVGARGAAMSGGERQRLALTRALLADPALLILDEPTAHLEPSARRALTADLFEVTAGRGTLLITHQPDGLDQADEIVVLDAGRVAARGTHAELLRAGGLYRWMWDRGDLAGPPVPPLPGTPEGPLHAQRHRPDGDQQPDVEQQLLQRADGLRPAPVHHGHADVRGRRDRRDRDEHAGERGRLGERQGHHTDQAGDDGDHDGEQVGGVDQVRHRPDSVQVRLGRLA